MATANRRFDMIVGLVLLGLAGATVVTAVLGRVRPLTVVAIEPADGDREVAVRTQLRVTFARPLDEAAARAAVTLSPPAAGSVSVAGRRLAFTPRSGLQAGTEYTLTVSPTVRDQAGRALAGPVVTRFRTRPLALIARTLEGTLLRIGLDESPPVRLAGPGVGEFTVGADGALAYVMPGEGRLILRIRSGERQISLPAGLRIRDVEWIPGERALMLLAGADGEVGLPYLVRPDDGSIAPFGPRPGPIDPGSALVVEALKKSLVEVVYRRESFALTPDGRAAIVRDQNWDFAVVALDGRRTGTLAPFLAVGNVAPRGDALTVVDVDPADAALRRQVFVYWTRGERVALSSTAHDSHSPRLSHAGDRVVFVTALPAGPPARRQFALALVGVASGWRRGLTSPPTGMTDGAPRWAPDDSWISFVRAPIGADGTADRVWLVPAEGGGDARPLATAATDARWLP